MSAGDVLFIIGGPVVLILPILLMIGPAMAMMGDMMMMASTPIGAILLLIVLALVGMFAYTVLFIGPG